MMRNRFFRWALAVLWIGVIFVAGCGKKGDPIPPKVALTAAVTELGVLSLRGE